MLTWLQPSILVELIMHQIQKSHVGKLSVFIFTGVCTGTRWTCIMAHKETLWTFVYWVNFAITPWWVYLRDSSVVSNVFAGKFWEIKSKMSLQILLTVTFASFQNYFKYKKFPLKIKTFKFQSDKHWSFRVRRISPVTPSGPITVEHLRLKWNCRQSCDLSHN